MMTIIDSFLSFFINSAYAEASVAPTAASPANNMSLLMMVGIFFFFIYFTVWRPQSKRAKEQRDLMNSLAKGDEVITSGGILGKIVKVNDSHIILSVADNVEIIVQKHSVASALPKGTLKSIQ